MKPIAEVKATNLNSNKISLSNANGQFNIQFNTVDSILFEHLTYETLIICAKDILQAQFTVSLSPKNNQLDEVSITIDAIRENAREQAITMSILDNKSIQLSGISNSASLLEQSGHIMVQKTQGGGGSPILRGFEANKVLLIVDGIRMNNAIYRNGHLQNSLTIDHAILDKIEVIYGAGSVLYGSDALGGVIHYRTFSPLFCTDEKTKSSAEFSSSIASATQTATIHAHQTFSSHKWASLISFTANSYGDTKMGGNRNNYEAFDNYSHNWGLVPHIAAKTYNGLDTIINNPNSLVQKRTGYKQYDAIYKLRYKQSKLTEYFVNIQLSTSSNIQRFDKLNDYSGDILKYADYYYGPQKRLLAAGGKINRNKKHFDYSKTIFAYQQLEESRVSRRMYNYDELHQIEKVNIFSVNSDYKKQFSKQKRFYYGYEAITNSIVSKAHYLDIFSLTQIPAQTRYPDAGSYTFSASSYTDYIYEFSNNWQLNTGVRLSYNYLSSNFNDTSFTQFPFEQINLQNLMPSGSVNISYQHNKAKLTFIQSSGFRSPNVDDYGKIRANDGFITLPNTDLMPEYTWHSELLTEYQSEKFNFSFSVFHDLLFNAIVRTTSSFNGADSLFYDGENYQIIINTNAEKAQIYGVAANSKLKIQTAWINTDYLEWSTSANYTKGTNLTQNVPLGHIPPFFMRSDLSYFVKNTETKLWFKYNDAKPLILMSPYGEDKEDEGTIYGYPSWWTLNFKFNISINDYLNAYFVLENIFDKHYKSFASAISAPGRNLILGLRVEI